MKGSLPMSQADSLPRTLKESAFSQMSPHFLRVFFLRYFRTWRKFARIEGNLLDVG